MRAFQTTVLSIFASSCLAKSQYNIPADNSLALTQPYYPSEADCWEYKVPVTVTSENLVFNFPDWKDDYALEGFLTSLTSRPGAGFPSPVVGTKNETASYTLAASFCTPKGGDKKKTIILATHGIGQARSHWNSAYQPDEYNFVKHAISKGYSVWFYDRLGTGQSEKVSGFTNQLRVQKAILVELAKLVKSGKYTGSFGKPGKIVLMGFSFGSFITHFTVAENPTLADGAVLTGIAYNTSAINGNGLLRSFVPRIASLQNPSLYGTLNPGYLTWVDKFAQINSYFKYPFYDIPTASYCEEYKQPFAIGEFLTITDGNFDASGFTGAALAITGKNDYIVCDGECDGIFEEPARTIWKNAKFTPYLHPNASHNFNFHQNATRAYEVITSFLKTNGL
ncbi:Alpha/Beta hydrolase protein [Dactylonectria estremocensis]|uniref:Alpha/Beta hydrolase protein n=1 Tax=Dactylonectria estremocensis TaxID=1079267 RepID=A0A9P9DLZ5_9HYPO|nr:Alpha/Beta hydrolase protein [Dactylonectria estremocensis]